MGDTVDGQTHDDDAPTDADVYVYLKDEQGGLPVRSHEYVRSYEYEDAVGEAIEPEIKNKIVEAVAAAARAFNERNNVGTGVERHCKRIALNFSVLVED